MFFFNSNCSLKKITGAYSTELTFQCIGLELFIDLQIGFMLSSLSYSPLFLLT